MHRSLLLLAVAIPSLAVAQPGPPARFAADRIVVRFTEPLGAQSEWIDAPTARLAAASGVVSARPYFPAGAGAGDAMRAARSAELRRSLGMDATYVLDLAAPADVEALAREWSALPGVVYAEPDFMGVAAGATGSPPVPSLAEARPVTEIPNDPFFNRQYNLHNTGTHTGIPSPTAGADVNGPEAWDITLGDPNLIFGILDSGLRLGHPDIAARVWTNPGEVANGLDDDGNGYIDDLVGWDFVNGDNDPTDDNGNGSNVAGTVGAIGNNELAYTGLDRAARLLILKVFDGTLSGFYSWWSSAIVYATDEGARVVNLSGGGSDFSASLETSVDYATGMGALFTAPTMNFNNAVTYYPAGFANAFAVGATNQRDERAMPYCWGGGSNWGEHIDLSAPGDYIYNITHSSDTNVSVYWCGSSMSAPTVGAAASLLLAIDPSLTVTELREILQSTAADQVGRPAEDVAGWDVYHGHGRLDALAALVQLTTATESGPAGAAAIALSPTYPNPSRDHATVAVTLQAAQPVLVEVFDALGRRVAVAHDGPLGAGTQTLALPTGGLPAGTYLVRATADAGAASRLVTVGRR